MKRYIFLLVGLICGGVCSLQAQEAKKCFTAMPDSLSSLLTEVNRADCIDFLESKMKAEVTNRFGGKSTMTELSPSYIRMQMTPGSTWQMKMLATSDTTRVICVVSTVCAPVCDSKVRFYTTDWRELTAADYLSLPLLNDFFTVPDTAMEFAVQLARQKADMLLMKADLHATDNTLTLTFTTPEFAGTETTEKLQPFLRPALVYDWIEGKFVARPVR